MRPVLLAVPAIAAAVLLTGAACSATESAPPASSTTGPAVGPPTNVGALAADTNTRDTNIAGTSTTGTSGAGTGTRGTSTGGTNTGGTNTAGKRAGGGSAGKGAGTGTGAAACRTGDVSADVTFQPERVSGNTRMAMVMLTNQTKHACTVDGWASISLVNAADEVVPVHTSEVQEPGAPVLTTLKPGTTAWAGIKWTACDKGDDTCGVGNTLRFNLQASSDGDVARLEGFPSPESSDITMKNLRIGSVQPIRIGVVAW